MKVEDCKYFAIVNKETMALLMNDSAYTFSMDKPEYHNIQYKGMNLRYFGGYIPNFHNEQLRTLLFGSMVSLFVEEN